MRSRFQRYYYANRERILERFALRNITRHKPDGNMPRALLTQVRLRCLALGFDPGSTAAMKMAAIELHLEAEPYSEVWCWLHPDEINNRSLSWAQKWRNSERLRTRVLERFSEMPDSQSG